MPTNEWFEQNPKVSAYIPKELHSHLEEWMAANGIAKTSQAIARILEEYLRVDQKIDQSRLPVDSLQEKRLEALEGKSKASLS